MRRYELVLYADHFQFCLEDEAADPPGADVWSPEASERLVATEAGRIWIGTDKEEPVQVAVEIHDSAPQPEMEKYEHIVDCSLVVRGQNLIAAGCTDDLVSATHIELPAGNYRVRVNFTSISCSPTHASAHNETFEIQIWPTLYFHERVNLRNVSGWLWPAPSLAIH